MQMLRIFRYAMIGLVTLAFLASALLLVSSAVMSAAAAQSLEPLEPLEPPVLALSGSGMAMAQLSQAETGLSQAAEPIAYPGADQAMHPVADQVADQAMHPVADQVAERAAVQAADHLRVQPTPDQTTDPVWFEGGQVLAFYGKPGAASMGILGEYSKEQLAVLLQAYADLYDQANGPLGVIPAFYIIYGTCWPEGEIGILRSSIVEEYIEFAAERGWLVFLDHQIGKYSVESAISAMLPFLKHRNVHLAIDPEWRTLKPMQEIGSITGAELNQAQAMMDAYLRDNALPGRRMLVVHQFAAVMIRQREVVTSDYERVILVHTADGIGSPALKRHSYAFNARASNMPVKGFKLFFESRLPGAGWDKPLMLPEEVLALDPLPLLIIYQ
jgi:hypothetical protein